MPTVKPYKSPTIVFGIAGIMFRVRCLALSNSSHFSTLKQKNWRENLTVLKVLLRLTPCYLRLWRSLSIELESKRNRCFSMKIDDKDAALTRKGNALVKTMTSQKSSFKFNKVSLTNKEMLRR